MNPELLVTSSSEVLKMQIFEFVWSQLELMILLKILLRKVLPSWFCFLLNILKFYSDQEFYSSGYHCYFYPTILNK